VSVPAATPEDAPLLRIGELSRRTGVGVDALRAWERRYGLLQPERSSGGFRLYGPGDEERVRAMKALIDSGVSAAEAARLAVVAPRTPVASGGSRDESPDQEGQLRAALERFREADANAILDDALARFSLDAVVSRVLLPVMRQIGDRWETKKISVAQEHFATGVVRGRMLSLGRNWGAGAGPLALLACPPGERHDLGLIAFGLVLRERGWRIAFLGSDTPIETIADAVGTLAPAAIVLAAVTAEPFEAVAAQIRALAGTTRVLIGGQGASDDLSERLGAPSLDADPIRGAAQLAGPG
jgi:MerR family transcriptional regulator, light-induced transcriptional regulator